MKDVLYYTTFSRDIEHMSKKGAESVNKPLVKRLKAFAAAFGAEIKFDDGMSQSGTPGFYVYTFYSTFEFRLNPGLVLGVASACQAFADLNGIKMSDESYHTAPEEMDAY